jgi:CheY-like chemotaxis protein
MTSTKKLEVLVVDDEEAVRSFLVRFLRFKGIEVEAVEDGLKAIEAAKRKRFDLVFLDIKMPRMNGLEVFGELKKIDPSLNCIFMTGYALEVDLLHATKQPGVICLKKPFEDLSQIEVILNQVLQHADIKSGAEGDRQDKRAYIRLDLALEVSYKLKQGPPNHNQFQTQNIGPGGIRFNIPESLAPGTLIELAMSTPDSGETLKATAEVIWSREAADKPGYHETGIKFRDIDFAAFTGFLVRCGIL